MLTCWAYCVIADSTGARAFEVNDTKHYVPAVTLSTHDNTKLLQQLKLGFKKQLTELNINQKYQSRHKSNISVT